MYLANFSNEVKLLFYKDIAETWENSSIEDIAKRWGIPKHSILCAAVALRGKGIPLSKKAVKKYEPIFTKDSIESIKKMYRE
jgi:hypothetical protein